MSRFDVGERNLTPARNNQGDRGSGTWGSENCIHGETVTRACAAHASMQLDSMIITVPHEYGSSPPC
ncbi:MAG: hypothetical protein ACPIOQ_68105, partial [Promethearchaeia archaeon]